MNRRSSTTLVVAALALGGVLTLGVGSAGAAAPTAKTYSESDCTVLNELNADMPVSQDNSGYDRGQLTAIGKAYQNAADDIDDKKLSAGLATLGKLYANAGKSRTQVGALVALGKGGKAFGKALKVTLAASMSCAFSGLSDITLPDITMPDLDNG